MFWLFFESTCALGIYNEIWNNSDITSTLKDQSLDEKKFSRFTMILRIRCLNFKVTTVFNCGGETRRYQGALSTILRKMHRFCCVLVSKQKMTIRGRSINFSRRKSFQRWMSYPKRINWSSRRWLFNFFLKIFEASFLVSPTLFKGKMVLGFDQPQAKLVVVEQTVLHINALSTQ